MKQRILLLASFLLLAIFTFAQSRSISAFNAVSAAGGVKVELIKSTSPKIEYKILKGNESDLITEVKNGVLTIKIKNKWGWGSSGAKADVKVYYTTLNKVTSSAGSSIQSFETINADDMVVSSSSGSRISLLLNAKSTTVNSSSGSTITLSGEVSGAGKFGSSSGSNINAAALSTNDANVQASSGSSVSLWVKNKISADASSGGSIKYKGTPTVVDSDKSSGGSVSKM
jgi:Putative auto-transporter adhesin, head GIN domain